MKSTAGRFLPARLPVRNWLREKIHRQGYRHEAEALIRAVTGQGLTDVDFVEALRSKYSALYGVAL